MSKEESPESIRERILHVLSVYPIISPTMLQVGLGTNIQAASWRPVLEELIAEGTVKQGTRVVKTPSGRHYTYTRIQLLGGADESGNQIAH